VKLIPWEVSNHLTGPYTVRITAEAPAAAAKKHALALDASTSGVPPLSRTVYVRLPLDASEEEQEAARLWGLAPRQVVTVEVRCVYAASVLAVGKPIPECPACDDGARRPGWVTLAEGGARCPRCDRVIAEVTP